MADGQVTQGNQIMKPNVRKTRRIGDNVIGGFAGMSLYTTRLLALLSGSAIMPCICLGLRIVTR